MRGRSLRLGAALLINITLTGGLLFAGHAANSSGLTADAGHNLTDAMAIGLALIAEIIALKPASERRSFGNQRMTILAALLNGVVLVAVTVSIGWFAIDRLIHPQPVHGGIVVVAASLSIIANLVVVWLLVSDHGDLNIRATLLHAGGDVLGSAVVAVSGLIIMIGHGPIAQRVDPVASLIVAGFIVVEAIKVTASSLHILLEGVPTDLDVDEVRQRLTDLDGITEIHDLHVWSLSSSHRALSAHAVLSDNPSVSATSALLEQARAVLKREFRIDHTTIELESKPCEAPAHE